MSTCSCSSTDLTSVTFVNGTVLRRCLAHETQQWLVHGRCVDRSVALVGLRELFADQRSRQPREKARPARVIQLPSAPTRSAQPASVDDAALTALLNSRGLSGSWAVA